MAKEYSKGLQYNLFLNSATYAAPNWVLIPEASEIDFDPDTVDIEVPERGIGMGHLAGKGNHKFNFTLLENLGNANVVTLIGRMATGDDTALTHLAISKSAAPTTGDVLYHMETKLMGTFSGDQADVAQWECEASRHAKSDNDFVRVTL